jgi:hypothetical protein
VDVRIRPSPQHLQMGAQSTVITMCIQRRLTDYPRATLGRTGVVRDLCYRCEVSIYRCEVSIYRCEVSIYRCEVSSYRCEVSSYRCEVSSYRCWFRVTDVRFRVTDVGFELQMLGFGRKKSVYCEASHL